MNDYFFFLNNNDCKNVYLDNKVSSFRVDLPRPISLSGYWEIGLVDVSFVSDFIDKEKPKELYFCLDCADVNYVQNKLINCLRRISLPINSDEHIYESFLSINYIRVTSSFLTSFHVYILSDKLVSPSFREQDLFCTFHLRERKH